MRRGREKLTSTLLEVPFFFVKPDILEVACKQDNMINTERDKTLFNGNQRLFKIMFSLDRNNSDIIV